MMDLMNSVSGFGNVVLAQEGGVPDPYACSVTMKRNDYDALKKRYPLFGKLYSYQLDCAAYDPVWKNMFSIRDEQMLLAQLKGVRKPAGNSQPVSCASVVDRGLCERLAAHLDKEVESKVEGSFVMASVAAVVALLSGWLYIRARRQSSGRKGDGSGPNKGDGNGPTGGGPSGGPRRPRAIELPRRTQSGGWARGRAAAPVRIPVRFGR